MLVIKAGGSVITRKGESPVFDRAAASRLAASLAELREPFALVHGTGSFGKPPALRYGYLSGRVPPGGAPVDAINTSLLRLHLAFLRELRSAGLVVGSVPGPEYFLLRGGRPVPADASAIEAPLASGLVPVVSSGIFPDGTGGGVVVSSDALAVGLCGLLRPRLAVFFTDAPGLLDAAGAVLPELDEPGLEAFSRACPREPGDVSGGMRGKAAELLEIVRGGGRALVLDGRRPEGLVSFLAGRSRPGTLLGPGRA